jgi:hypothetical protein
MIQRERFYLPVWVRRGSWPIAAESIRGAKYPIRLLTFAPAGRPRRRRREWLRTASIRRPASVGVMGWVWRLSRSAPQRFSRTCCFRLSVGCEVPLDFKKCHAAPAKSWSSRKRSIDSLSMRRIPRCAPFCDLTHIDRMLPSESNS